MSAIPSVQPHGGRSTFLQEPRKALAFFRRDLLVLVSYRFALVSDWLALLFQLAIFTFVARMIDPTTMPVYGGHRVDYLAFVTVGIALSAFIGVGMGRVVTFIREEQLMGTLESLLTTPTRITTIQLGSAFFDTLYIPVRTLVFLALAAALFNVDLSFQNLGAGLLVLGAFIPVVWGLGVTGAAAVLTFRRGGNFASFATMAAGAASGAFFPIDLLPEWVQWLNQANPIAIALEGMRQSLLAGQGMTQLWPTVATLAGMSVATLLMGTVAFRLALRRELRRGTLSEY